MNSTSSIAVKTLSNELVQLILAHQKLKWWQKRSKKYKSHCIEKIREASQHLEHSMPTKDLAIMAYYLGRFEATVL